MTIYYFGDDAISRRPFSGCINMKPLRLWHLPTLSKQDTIISPRPWSILVETIMFWAGGNRPKIIQVSDGIAFPRNSQKKINRRYGGLYNEIFADVFLAGQNLADFRKISSDARHVLSTSVSTITMGDCFSPIESAFLVSGNDPFLGISQRRVLSEFVASARLLRDLGVKNILVSSPNRKLASGIKHHCPWIHEIGRLKDYEGDLSQAVMLGSPSTVLFDHQKNGGVSLMLSIFSDEVLDGYFSSEKCLKECAVEKNGLTFKALRIADFSEKKFDIYNLSARLQRRPPLDITFMNYIRSFRIRIVLRELHLLVGGS